MQRSKYAHTHPEPLVLDFLHFAAAHFAAKSVRVDAVEERGLIELNVGGEA